MKIGLNSRVYHRFLGDPSFEIHTDPCVRWTILDVIQKTVEFGLDAIVLDASLMPSLDRLLLREIARQMDDNDLGRVLSWGHLSGAIAPGKAHGGVQDLLAHMDVMEILGTRVMCIHVGEALVAEDPRATGVERLANLIGERCIVPAERAGVTLAIENDWGFTSDALLELIGKVDSPYLKICFDGANALIGGEDPVETAKRLAPHVVSVRLKDIGRPIVPPQDPRGSFPSVPFGHGLINIGTVCRELVAAASVCGAFSIEMDRPREDFLDEDRFVLECAGYMRAVRQSL